MQGYKRVDGPSEDELKKKHEEGRKNSPFSNPSRKSPMPCFTSGLNQASKVSRCMRTCLPCHATDRGASGIPRVLVLKRLL